MKIRRKTNRCLNCGHTLGEIYNFCPHCGQENTDKNVSFGTFVGDFFANYFSFDTRIGRSIKPFFLQPGYLTNRFNEGKRMRYTHPLRLYLVASVIFFFFLSLVTRIETRKNLANADDVVVFSDSSKLSDFERIMADETLTTQQTIDSLKKTGAADDLPENWLERRLFSGGRKVQTDGPEWFLNSFIQNLPIALLLAMPALALLLKLAYYRHRIFYVNHLIHTLHLHTVALVLFSVVVPLSLLFDDSSDVKEYILDLPVVLLLLAYVFISFIKVYQQRWWITLIKLAGVLLVYSVVLALTIGLIAVIALLDF